MYRGYGTPSGEEELQEVLATQAAAELRTFLSPLLEELDQHLDVRLVRTVLRTVLAILLLRHRAAGLLLSELGGYILGAAHAPAGTKRLSNLLRSKKWTAAVVEQFLWARACAHVETLAQTGHTALAVWDESVLEKPESEAAAGLCPVRSSKARRLTHPRKLPGYYRRPGPPVVVPGFHWLGVLVLGMQGPPTLAALRWWTTRGTQATTQRAVEEELLAQCAAWGRQVLHVFDRGFAGTPWLEALLTQQLRFVVRWRGRYELLDAQGVSKPAWQHLRGKRTWGQRLIWDARRRCERKTGVCAVAVRHPARPDVPLWLVVARPGHGQDPWYLLTSEPVETEQQAWPVVLAYARRWQVEQTWRYSKSELAMESPRLETWERCHKLLLLAALAYAFLLSLLSAVTLVLTRLLLCWGCRRTGRRLRTRALPLYRLRNALTRLWQLHPPTALTGPLPPSLCAYSLLQSSG